MSPLINTDDLHRIFDKLDRNGDGRVSLDELRWLLERFDVKTSQDEMRTLVGKTKLDFIDFFLFYESVIKQNYLEGESSSVKHGGSVDDVESDLAKVFKVYDLNGDGYITCEELQSVLSQLGLWNEHCGKDCRRMINVYDTNSDGVLDFEEFKNMMLLTNSSSSSSSTH